MERGMHRKETGEREGRGSRRRAPEATALPLPPREPLPSPLSLLAVVRRFPHFPPQLLDRQRLHQDALGGAEELEAPSLRQGLGGNEDETPPQLGALQQGLAPEPQSVPLRHGEIGDHDVHADLTQQLERFEPATGRRDPGAPPLERAGQRFAQRKAGVDQQDGEHFLPPEARAWLVPTAVQRCSSSAFTPVWTSRIRRWVTCHAYADN